MPYACLSDLSLECLILLFSHQSLVDVLYGKIQLLSFLFETPAKNKRFWYIIHSRALDKNQYKRYINKITFVNAELVLNNAIIGFISFIKFPDMKLIMDSMSHTFL